MQEWWDSLSVQRQIYWAYRGAVKAGSSEAEDDVLYIIEKPWKWQEEAYQAWLEETATIAKEGVVP